MRTEKEAEQAGYDSEMHGSNTVNCHFTFFATPALTKAWELGRRKAIAGWLVEAAAEEEE